MTVLINLYILMSKSLDIEALAPKCSMADTTKIHFSGDELQKWEILKLLISDCQPVVIFGETGKYMYPPMYQGNLQKHF